MRIQFFKYQGTGNDFVILDNRDYSYKDLSAANVKFLCDRRFGIGADGLMLLNLLDGYDFEMKYYNADGNESSMCGNGGRCLVQFASDLGMMKEHYHFLAVDGPHEATIDSSGWVRLKMKDVASIDEYEQDAIVDTGSPHYVQFVADVANEDVFKKGRQIRFSEHFKAEGINVNFVERGDHNIKVRTYERGVEDETFSCGTGVTACALVSAGKAKGHQIVDISTPGGQLKVEFEKSSQGFSNIWLCGPATFVFKGEIEV